MNGHASKRAERRPSLSPNEGNPAGKKNGTAAPPNLKLDWSGTSNSHNL